MSEDSMYSFTFSKPVVVSQWNSKERITFSLLFKVSTYDISDLLEIFDIV